MMHTTFKLRVKQKKIFWTFCHYDRVGPKLRIMSVESKIRLMESKDKANGKESWDCVMAAFRCRGQKTL